MNLIAIIILVALCADWLLNLWADYLNLRRLRHEVPQAFEGVYSPERYQQAQDYLKTNTRFGWIVGTFNLTVLLIFWFGHGFAWLDQWVRGWQLDAILSGLLYIGLLAVVKSSLGLPFKLYATFVIEQKFGFNRTTWQTFIQDLFKGTLLAIIVGGPLLTAVLVFFAYAGDNAWWWCWVIVTLFMLLIQWIAPTWIMPLFNKFEPLAEGELKQAIMAYARAIRFRLDNIFVMDGSKRSAKSNAFFTGFGKHKRIVLFDTLIAKHSVAELLAVLAHEMGHYKKHHIQIGLLLGILQTGLMFYILSLFITHQDLYAAFFVRDASVYAGLVFFGLLYAPLDFFMGLIMNRISRRNEYAADRFAVETTTDGGPMIRALKKLSVDNLSNLEPHPLYVTLNYSHPPVLQRIAAIQKLASSQSMAFASRD
jgi:STE24 endopeptidase